MTSIPKLGRLLVLVALLLAACQSLPPTGTPHPSPTPTVPVETAPWWNDAVFYEVFVRSFYDSDGDTYGDLRGLIQRLDYLNDGDPTTTDDLGVTALWLMPVMESPSYHGYDVVDYYTVEKDYGTDEDFRALVAEAHARNIRVIVDLPLNHTSNGHPWFVDALVGPQAEHYDWYVWAAEYPGYRGPWGQQVWHRRGDAFYYGLFGSHMPDLNYRNPEVTAQMRDVARFWLEEMGADGLRLDAVQHLIEEGEQQANTEATHEWLTGFDRFTDEIGPEVLTVGEVWASTADAAPYVSGGELDLVFEFDLAEAILESVLSADPMPLRHSLEVVLSAYPPGQFATFLTNHDQERVMSRLQGDLDGARLAATTLLTLPGVPFIYYGEEIGMRGQKPDEWIRTPMQWTAERHAGFTSAWPWHPINDDDERVNVAVESADPGSLLNHYRRLIHLRADHAALRRGELIPMESSCPPVFGFLRHHEAESVMVLLNFAAQEQQGCAFSVAGSPLTSGDYTARDLLTGQAAAPLAVTVGGGFSDYAPLATLSPRGGYLLRLEPAGQ